MTFLVEDLDDQNKFRQILAITYHDLVKFILDYLKRKSGITIIFWSVCLIFLTIAIKMRINIAEYFPLKKVLLHSVLGFVVFPVICIPVHELLHLISFFLSGAKRLRIGMDLKQNLFYVTAHRYVTPPLQFKIVAIIPFLIISISVLFLVLTLPGLWKWSFSVLLFVHATMCAGDFALLNFYYLNRHKKIYTWDDADQKIAYFYEKI